MPQRLPIALAQLKKTDNNSGKSSNEISQIVYYKCVQ